MSDPKRHHWWPQLQSGEWVGADGNIYVTRPDGTFFKSTPLNIGVQGELYTRFQGEDGDRDRAIEKWFDKEVDGPFVKALEALTDASRIMRRRALDRGSEAHRLEIKSLGFSIKEYNEMLTLTEDEHRALVRYLAASIVRHPSYIQKLNEHHSEFSDLSGARIAMEKATKNAALANALHLFEIYVEAIDQSSLVMTIAESEKEFLFSDGGVYVAEPWRGGPLPFDAFAPITPRIGISILPLPWPTRLNVAVFRCNSQLISRYNRNTLSQAKRFVYSRQRPPSEFIKKHFGKVAAAPFGHRVVNGILETHYDRSRDV